MTVVGGWITSNVTVLAVTSENEKTSDNELIVRFEREKSAVYFTIYKKTSDNEFNTTEVFERSVHKQYISSKTS